MCNINKLTNGLYVRITSMQVEATSDTAGLIVPSVYMFYTEETENAEPAKHPRGYVTHGKSEKTKSERTKLSIQNRYADLMRQMSRGLVFSEESERSSESPPGQSGENLPIYGRVVCEEKDKRCVCFKARQGIAEVQVQELVRRLRMSIWLEEEGSRSVAEVMNDVFWERAETTPRHEAWLAFSSSTGEGIREEEEV